MTIEDTELVQVRNLTDSSVVYFSYLGQRRFFEAQQMMPIPAGELRQLNYTKGGRVLLKDYLSIRNEELARELGIQDYDNEYSWTIDDIDKMLLDTSAQSMDVLEDALEFAPEGIIESIVSRAVELRLPDSNKRRVIKEWTDKDVDSMITSLEAVEASIEENAGLDVHHVKEKGKRRVQNNSSEPKKRTRRVTTSVAEVEATREKRAQAKQNAEEKAVEE